MGQYIGEKEIVKVKQIDGDNRIIISFKDEEEKEATIDKGLFDLIVLEKQGKGNVMDAVRYYFAKKFLSELALYDLDFYMVENIGVAMQTLSHNLREDAIGKMFECSGALDIKLRKLI